MDKLAMRGLLKEMERAAEQILQEDAAFFEALQALKWEIDNDPRVELAIRNLQAAGQKVYSSFAPHIKVRIRTENGVFALPKPAEIPGAAVVPGEKLSQELKDAASAVIRASRCCQELERIVNEAVTSSERFESVASQLESAGYEVLISLDLSAYAQVQASADSSTRPERFTQPVRRNISEERLNIELSSYDLTFLRALKIKADENLLH
jgi:hypothetical protein